MKSFIVVAILTLWIPDRVTAQATTPEEAIQAWYETHTFEGGQHPEPEAYLRLFTPSAEFFMVEGDSLITLSAASYVEQWVPYASQFEQHEEKEIGGGEIQRFGNVAQGISVFVTVSDGVEIGRGLNFFQLAQQSGVWRIHFAALQVASESLPIPSHLLWD